MGFMKYLALLMICQNICEGVEWTETSAMLKPSAIEGVGVFATHDIPQGTKVLSADFSNTRVYEMKSLPKSLQKYCLFISETHGLGPQRFDRMEIEWFINHSNHPNILRINDTAWVAAKDISEGEELLINYNQYNEVEELKEEYYRP